MNQNFSDSLLLQTNSYLSCSCSTRSILQEMTVKHEIKLINDELVSFLGPLPLNDELRWGRNLSLTLKNDTTLRKNWDCRVNPYRYLYAF